MSSLLNALKQQQSATLRGGSEVNPEMLDRPAQGASVGWGFWLMLVVGGLLLVALVWQSWLVLKPEPSAHSAMTPTSKQDQPTTFYELGRDYDVTALTWQAEPDPVSNEPEPIIVNPQAETNMGAANERQPLDLNDVSADLLAKFEQAMAATNGSDNRNKANAGNTDSVVPLLSTLSADFRGQIPSFSYDAHMYVSNANERWVELNQQRFYSGERFNGLRIEQIEPQRLILSRQGKAFAIEALQDWSAQ